MTKLQTIFLLLQLSTIPTTFGQKRNFWTGNATSFIEKGNYDYGCSPDSSCFALQVINKTKSENSSSINPFYSPEGLYIIKNGVYNFVIRGKTYFYYRVNNITSDSIYISYAFDSATVIAFSPHQQLGIKFFSLDNGRVGWPNEKLSSDNYLFTIVKQSKFCSIKSEKICLENDCTKSVISNYQYMTSGFGWKPLYLDGGYGYMLDKNIRHVLYNPKKKRKKTK